MAYYNLQCHLEALEMLCEPISILLELCIPKPDFNQALLNRATRQAGATVNIRDIGEGWET